MTHTPGPIHLLRDRLETARLEAIRALASQSVPMEAIPADLLRRVSDLHIVLTAVRDEIEAHEVREGFGGGKPSA